MESNMSMAISIISLLISVVSFYVAWSTLREQKEYNRICEMPIPYISTLNYDNEIGLEIKNCGKGILFIEKTIFKNSEGYCSDCLMDLMPDDINWKNYFKFANILAISPNEKVAFICLTSDDDDERYRARAALENISISIKYRDVYNHTYHYETNFKGYYL